MTTSQFCKNQYEFVRDSRKVVFTYCKTISGEHLLTAVPSFGRGGSIRNLLVHIANTYQFWIAKQCLKREVVFTQFDLMTTINDVVLVFDTVDATMNDFFMSIEVDENRMIDYEINGGTNSASALKLFSHVISHEFHHKGQILSISRQLGYIPVDTDIMR